MFERFDAGVSLERDLFIDEANFSEEFVKQASLVAYYGIAYQNAAAARRDAELELDFLEADAMQAARLLLAGQKVTEATIKEVVMTNETLQVHKRLVNGLIKDEEILKVQYTSIQEKGKQLMSFGGVRRSELESNVRMLAR